jgi:phosphoribosyl-ATP pyrophosphohydrolase
MAGFDFQLVERAVAAAGGARVTAAGGITEPAEVAALHRIGADAQVGMALYSGHMTLGRALGAPLAKPVEGDRWPTVVVDENGRALGLVWSTRASLERAVAERRGIYWSRSRNEIWVKGETSGAAQELLAVDLDCDDDALRFTVRQHGSGFCHTGSSGCWDSGFSLGTLEDTISDRISHPRAGSGTNRLLADDALLAAKLREEAGELARSGDAAAAVHEAADLIYFTMVRLGKAGGRLTDVVAELARRHGRLQRRPMESKEPS